MGASDLPRVLRKVLSAEGQYEIDIQDREKVCLLSDGTLLIANSYRMDHAVLAFQELLKHRKFAFKVEVVNVEQIRKEYQSAATKGERKGESHRQKEAVALITEAVALGASDIHFRNERESTKILMRIDGFLQMVHSLKLEDGMAICATMYGSMCEDAEPTYKPKEMQDGRLKQEYLQQCGLYGARIATRPRNFGNLFVLRLLPEQGAMSLEALGYEESKQIPLIRRMTKRTDGINIFSGPTGSGKSTSLQALLSQLLKQFNYSIHLLTIEDPTEYELPGAVQTPLLYDRSDVAAGPIAWARAISNAMRLDPDTIMVGEMRDKMSATTAFKAAMTGHGVWTTLHANNAIQSLDRLIDMGVADNFVTDASIVTGLINQSLSAKNCPACRRPYLKNKFDVADDLQERIEKFCIPSKVFLRGKDKGCKVCNGKGYKSRTVLAEVVLTNQAIMNAYRSGGTSAARFVWVKQQGGITKNMHLIQKINEGLIDPEIGEQKVCPIDYDELTIQ